MNKIPYINKIFPYLVKSYLNTAYLYKNKDYKQLEPISKLNLLTDINFIIWGSFFHIYKITKGENIFTLFSNVNITQKDINANNIYKYNKLILFYIKEI